MSRENRMIGTLVIFKPKNLDLILSRLYIIIPYLIVVPVT
jgi:hypothetical protein